MLEIEKTFLAKKLPEGLFKHPSKEIIDIYIPRTIEEHAPIRIRKNANKYEITKKSRLNKDDGSQLVEQTIQLTEEEFKLLEKEIAGRRVHKIRYNYPYKGLTAEVDVFLDALKGLVIIEFEFANEAQMKEFAMPEFCLAEITNQGFSRGGMLCGKSYAEIEPQLKKYGYKKMEIKD